MKNSKAEAKIVEMSFKPMYTTLNWSLRRYTGHTLMNYGLTLKPELSANQCLVLGLYSDMELTDFAPALDKDTLILVSQLAKRASETGDMVWHTDSKGQTLLLVQCGNHDQYTSSVLKKRLAEIIDSLLKQRFNSAILCLPQLLTQSPDWQLEKMILQLDYHLYQLLDYKKKNPKKHQLENIHFYLPDAHSEVIEKAQAIAAGIKLTRHLANMPANVCTPVFLAKEAQSLAKEFNKVQCNVFGPDEMQTMGMGALLAVSQGSSQPPRLIEINYQGADEKSAPIVLVGKGITFDSGGLSLKPANAMDEMKYDMSGAACVLGTLKACASLQLPVNLIGIIPSAENMISGSAVKPGDIVTTMSGQTIEIINTDAEGRLVLADALTYAERFKPEFVIDIATLTGAMVVALGSVSSGFMTQDDEIAKLIQQAAEMSEDKAWRMPLDEDYQEAIDSPLADMLNATFDRTAGSITAACFLSRFTQNYRWAHLDIAGTAWVSGKKRNATGRPVPLLIQLIRHVASSR